MQLHLFLLFYCTSAPGASNLFFILIYYYLDFPLKAPIFKQILSHILQEYFTYNILINYSGNKIKNAICLLVFILFFSFFGGYVPPNAETQRRCAAWCFLPYRLRHIFTRQALWLVAAGALSRA